jgi:hypothetical protein
MSKRTTFREQKLGRTRQISTLGMMGVTRSALANLNHFWDWAATKENNKTWTKSTCKSQDKYLGCPAFVEMRLGSQYAIHHGIAPLELKAIYTNMDAML